MRCYNHPEKDVVATCLDCGRGLCADCVERWGMPLCDGCNSTRVVNDRKQMKKIIGKMSIAAALGFMLGLLFLSNTYEQQGVAGLPQAIWQCLLITYIFGSIPAGWNLLNRITPKVFLILPIFGWVIYFMIKFFLAYMIGWLIMPYRLYKIKNRYQELRAIEEKILKQ